MLKKVIELNLDDLCLVLGVPAGLFLLTHLITAGVLVFFHADSSLMISGALLPVCSGILMAIVTVAHVGISFFHFLRFGQTRQRALAQSMGIIAFEGGCSPGRHCPAYRVGALGGAPAVAPSNRVSGSGVGSRRHGRSRSGLWCVLCPPAGQCSAHRGLYSGLVVVPPCSLWVES